MRRGLITTAVLALALVASGGTSAHIPRLKVDEPTTCSAKGALFGLQRSPDACWRPYSDESPFNRAIPPRPQLFPRASRIVSRTTALGEGPKFDGGIAGTRDDWGHPLYFSARSNPVFKVHCTRSSGWGPCEVEGARVRIPDAARPAGGGDGHMAVIDQASGWEYDFWQVKQKPAGGGTLTVSYGGKTRIEGNDATGLDSQATAAGFGLAAGVIRPEEMAAGRIDHALFMVVKCTNGTAVWPAAPGSTGRSCASIGIPNVGAPAMGQRFFLDMSAAQIDALAKPAWQKTILRAMAEYGLYVGDTGGMGWGIKLQSGASYTSFGYPDPWASLGRRYRVPTWDGAPDGQFRYIFDLREAVSWRAKLRVLRACVSRLRCS